MFYFTCNHGLTLYNPNNHNEGQINLALDGIDANWGFRHHKSPRPVGGPGPLFNTMLLGTTQVSLLNGISFRPMALTGITSVTHDMQTDIHITVSRSIPPTSAHPQCALILF